MPKNPSLQQRIDWHLEHHKNCGCRELPSKLKEGRRGESRLKIKGHELEHKNKNGFDLLGAPPGFKINGRNNSTKEKNIFINAFLLLDLCKHYYY